MSVLLFVKLLVGITLEVVNGIHLPCLRFHHRKIDRVSPLTHILLSSIIIRQGSNELDSVGSRRPMGNFVRTF
jgi:hypothetical protein